MKKAIVVLMMSVVVILAMTVGMASAEEAAWYDGAENWIVRVYSAPAGADYSVTMEVVDTGNNLVTDTIAGMATNPVQITGAADSPEVSLAFDEGSATAYVFYTAGGVMLQAVPDIRRQKLTVGPNPLAYGVVAVGSSLVKKVTVQNSGATPLSFTSTGAPGAPFISAAMQSTCAVGTPVAAGGSCTIAVRFTPTAAVPYSGSFTIVSSMGNVTVNLNGSGR